MIYENMLRYVWNLEDILSFFANHRRFVWNPLFPSQCDIQFGFTNLPTPFSAEHLRLLLDFILHLVLKPTYTVGAHYP